MNTIEEVERLARKYWNKESALVFKEDVNWVIEKALDDQKKDLREIVEELENTNEDVWTGYEVKKHIFKELDKLK